MTRTPSREDKLERECMRLAAELARLRDRDARWYHNFFHVRKSLTWRFMVRANALLARLLRVQGPPPAWHAMEGLLDEDLQARGARDALVADALAGARGRHAAGSTAASGLQRAQPGSSLLSTPQRPAADAGIGVALFGDGGGDGNATDVVSAWLAARNRADLAAPGDGLQGVVLLLWRRLSDEEERQVAKASSGLPAGVRRVALAEAPRHTLGADDQRISEQLRAVLNVADGLALQRWWHDLVQEMNTATSAPDFAPEAYLVDNPDVAEAIALGIFASAEDHWKEVGKWAFLNGYRSYSPRRDPPSLGLREASDALRDEALAEVSGWSSPPIISVLMPVYKVPVTWLRAAVDSVREQLYPHWQLCIVDDGSQDGEIAAYLATMDDARINVVNLAENRGIAGATQVALEQSTGDFVALLDHDDELTVDALWLIARVVVEHDADIVYSDEATLALDGKFVHVHFKPDFSREMILAQNYICHVGVYRRDIAERAGGFRAGYEGSQDHDFLLRCLAQARSAFHISRVLYFWRAVPGSTASRFQNKNHAWEAGREAVQAAVAEIDSGAAVAKGRYPGTYRVSYTTPQSSVAIVIPFRDKPELLDACLESLQRTLPFHHGTIEIIGVNNGSEDAVTASAMHRWAQQLPQLRFLDYDQPFNFSAINNFASQQTNAEHLLFLNNDVTAVESGWFEELLAYSSRPDIGAVGAKLLYPDDTVQHAGVILGVGGVAGHSHRDFPANEAGYFSRPNIAQNVSAVTGACMMVETNVFRAVGGFEEQHLGVAFNDVDLCLRLLEAGYRNVFTPHACLYHHESKSRGYETTPSKLRRFGAERKYMLARHHRALSRGDPWYNPNLSLASEDFAPRHKM